MDICAKFVIIMFPKFQISLFQFVFKTLTPNSIIVTIFSYWSIIYYQFAYLVPNEPSMEGNKEDENAREGKKY
jgi:hypothetical protein